jgi:DNA-binding NtrC family response regulator
MKKSESIRVFVVDDDKMFRLALEQHLRRRIKLPLSYMTFPSGEACLEYLYLRPDIILLDYQLSSDGGPAAMNGVDVLTKILKLMPSVPVIMVSGNASVKTVVDAMKQGACDFIEKNEEALNRVEIRIKESIRSMILFGKVENGFFLKSGTDKAHTGRYPSMHIQSRIFFSPVELPGSPAKIIRARKKRKTILLRMPQVN